MITVTTNKRAAGRSRVSRTFAVVLALALTGAPVVRAQSFDQNRDEQRDNASPARPSQAQAPAAPAAPVTEQGFEPDQIETRDPERTSQAGAATGAEGGQSATADTRERREQAQRQAQSPRAALSEFETFISEVVDKPLRRFGSNLLVPAARDFTVPPTAAVPLDYQINSGDQIVVGLTGSVRAANLRLVVDSEGRIFIPNVGAVRVGGVRYVDLQGVIARAVARQYRGFRVAVSLGELHGITVYVTGFAAVPGSYTVSSLSTLINAVLAAGGPSAGGSFRSIQVRRGGRLVSDFDLYDLLLRGDKSADVMLQDGDVIFIAPAGAQVAITGSVNSEAIYEARGKETLSDLLLFAGGVNTIGDDSRLMVFNPVNVDSGGWEELSPAVAATRIARRGEILRVLSAVGIPRPLERQPVLVTIGGEVAKPGRYYLRPGTSLNEAIAQAGGLTGAAFPFGSVFTRDSVRRQQRLSYQRAIRDAETLLTAEPLVQANSDQLQPARLDAVRNLVQQLRSREPDGRLILEVDPTANQVPGDIVLENDDALYVPPQPVTVGVFGSVPSPASFRFERGLTLGDYIKRAGGIQKIGDKSGIFVVRSNGKVLAIKRGMFRGSILSQPALPGDVIFVPIDANRGAFWARLRDITATLFQGAVATAAVASVVK